MATCLTPGAAEESVGVRPASATMTRRTAMNLKYLDIAPYYLSLGMNDAVLIASGQSRRRLGRAGRYPIKGTATGFVAATDWALPCTPRHESVPFGLGNLP